jgi:hypothetical protein
MSANAQLLDAAVDHAIDLTRYSTGVVYRIMAELNRADARLVAALAEALLRLDAQSFTVERLEALLSSVRALNAEAYAAVRALLEAELKGLAEVEAAAQAAQLRSAIPPVVQLRFPIAAVSADQVYAAALSQPFQGRLLRDWAASLADGRLRQVREAVRQGYVDGQTSADIIRRVRGTRALRYADGLLERPRRELATIVQTALSHTAQIARQASYDANADLLKGVKWTATLDSRTTKHICAPRDGKMYTADRSHKPIGHKLPWLGGPGRLHFNCRSVSVPITKSWRELGIDADDMTPGQRASMDGAVPADMTYAQWFAKQSAARQDEIVGPTRGQLFRAGKLTFDRFTDDRGRWLTLEQLRKRAGS